MFNYLFIFMCYVLLLFQKICLFRSHDSVLSKNIRLINIFKVIDLIGPTVMIKFVASLSFKLKVLKNLDINFLQTRPKPTSVLFLIMIIIFLIFPLYFEISINWLKQNLINDFLVL